MIIEFYQYTYFRENQKYLVEDWTFRGHIDGGGGIRVPTSYMKGVLIWFTHPRVHVFNRFCAENASYKPRVLSLEGLDPLAVGGGWLPEMKIMAGGVDGLYR